VSRKTVRHRPPSRKGAPRRSSSGETARVDATPASVQTRRAPHPLLFTWKSLVQRCINPRSPWWPYYGGRGITVCDRWRQFFAAFCEDVGERPLGTTLDRIDNDGPYAPGNVRWASRKEQARNRCTTRLITWQGKTRTLTEWARLAGMASATLHSRLERGLPLGEAMRRPIEVRFRPIRRHPPHRDRAA
jgi:hypothetical protein